MRKQKELNKKILRRKKRVRAKIKGTADRPRLSVFRSNYYTYAQLIDDSNQKTLAAVSSRGQGKLTKAKAAEKVGELIAEKAQTLGIKKAVFDRGPYKYHGRVKAIVEGAKQKGLKI